MKIYFKQQIEKVFQHIHWPKGYTFKIDKLFETDSIMKRKRVEIKFNAKNEKMYTGCIVCKTKIDDKFVMCGKCSVDVAWCQKDLEI